MVDDERGGSVFGRDEILREKYSKVFTYVYKFGCFRKIGINNQGVSRHCSNLKLKGVVFGCIELNKHMTEIDNPK